MALRFFGRQENHSYSLRGRQHHRMQQRRRFLCNIRKSAIFLSLLLVTILCSIVANISFHLLFLTSKSKQLRYHVLVDQNIVPARTQNIQSNYKDLKKSFRPRVIFSTPDLDFKSDDNTTSYITLNPRETNLFLQLQQSSKNKSWVIDDPMLQNNDEAAPSQERHFRDPYVRDDCVPMKDWQTQSFPNCNSLHELSFFQNTDHRNGKLLARGWFRHTWAIQPFPTDDIVLKTLRLERDFFDEYYDLHRRDAVAMERLTFSPYVMDIYGYCGQSALNEYASKHHLESFVKEKHFRDFGTKYLAQERLKIAYQIATGLQHIHELDYDSGNNATLVHYDINPRNIAIARDGTAKLNDFNLAEFLRWNVTSNQTCPFSGRFHDPWWRAPEEMLSPSQKKTDARPLLNEKVDIYSLGNIMYIILTGRTPRGKNRSERRQDAIESVQHGVAPKLDNDFIQSKDPAIQSLRKATAKCYVKDPKQRSSAREIAQILFQALEGEKPKP